MRFQRIHKAKTLSMSWQKSVWIRAFVILGTIAVSPVAGGGFQQTTTYHYPPPEIVRAPDSNQRDQINKQQIQKQNFEAANAERKKQINADSAKLLKLATDLKAEVDKTNQDTLSIGVIRKADEVEKLAHDIKEKMKLTVGPG